jgi:hypothetical protein
MNLKWLEILFVIGTNCHSVAGAQDLLQARKGAGVPHPGIYNVQRWEAVWTSMDLSNTSKIIQNWPFDVWLLLIVGIWFNLKFDIIKASPMFGRNQMSSEWAFYTNPKALLEQNSTGTRSSWSFFGLNDVWGCLRFGWCQWLKSQEVDHGRASTFGWCFMMFVPQIVCHAGKSWNQPQHSPPFRWRHSGGLLDSTMWSTSRSSALRPGILMNRKLWVVGPESWKDLNFCHYPGRGSGVQVMLLCLFFAKRGEALSESWVSSNCDYHYGFIQCLSSFWYQQNSFFWVCRCTCTPNVHRMYTECTPNVHRIWLWINTY